jgi:putative phosphoesterase
LITKHHSDKDEIIVGVVSDTHVPDRVSRLHPELLASLKTDKVELILHAGDITIPSVLRQFEEIAPVFAVRGNRDWAFRNQLPLLLELNIGGMTVVLVHGHGGLVSYFRDKWYYITQGYRLERYLTAFKNTLPKSRVVVFGHTHHPVSLIDNERYYFNPGSATIHPFLQESPTYGILRFGKDGVVTGQIKELSGARLSARRWLPEGSKGKS